MKQTKIIELPIADDWAIVKKILSMINNQKWYLDYLTSHIVITDWLAKISAIELAFEDQELLNITLTKKGLCLLTELVNTKPTSNTILKYLDDWDGLK